MIALFAIFLYDYWKFLHIAIIKKYISKWEFDMHMILMIKQETLKWTELQVWDWKSNQSEFILGGFSQFYYSGT